MYADENATRRPFALGLSLCMAAALALSVSQARAQSGGNQQAAAAGTAPASSAQESQKTRSRRVEESPDETGASKSASDEGQDAPPLFIGKSPNGGDRLSTLRSQIEEAKTEGERARLRRTLVDYLVALGRKGEAVGELRVMSREERVDPIGFYNIGNALARLGDTDTAIDAYRKAIKQRHGNYARAYNNLGVMLYRQGRWDEAQEAFVSALRLENFRYGEASYNLGRVYAALGQAGMAIKEWTRVLYIQPDHSDAAIALARAYAEDGSPERGLAVLDTFVTRRGPSAEMAEARREILFGGEEAASSARTSPAVAVKTADAKAPAAGQGASSRTGREPASSKSSNGARASARLRPLSVDRETYDLLEKARSAREAERNEEAVSLYRRVIARSQGFLPPANLELGFVLTNMKRFDEAAAALGEVAKREGARYPIAYYHLGRLYEALGQLDLAAGAFEKAAAAFGDENPQFLLDVSRVREKSGDARAALAAMETYARINQAKGSLPDWTNERLAQLREKAGKQ